MMDGNRHDVQVGDRTCTVFVCQKSDTLWIAVGEHQGDRIEVKATSETAAIASWWKVATPS